MKNIHPFPARMAPEIVSDFLESIRKGGRILDPMAGSGTVLRQAVVRGYDAIGYDSDPLAIMMSRAWVQRVRLADLGLLLDQVLSEARSLTVKQARLNWIDSDEETSQFINFWFAKQQQNDLRKIAFILHKLEKNKNIKKEINILKVAFSRIIITKKKGASLGWDISHSRPHKVKERNNFDVWSEYMKSVYLIKARLSEDNIVGKAMVHNRDVRKMGCRAKSIDAVITSPPYLNAIDYLRGHKLSLVWLGYTIRQIRKIRDESIGVEKGLKSTAYNNNIESVKCIINPINQELKKLSGRHQAMVFRYAGDAYSLMKQVSRVLKPRGRALFVVGNSCIYGTYVKNSEIFKKSAEIFNLECIMEKKRNLRVSSRYLPINIKSSNALSKRMKKEIILEFQSH